MANVVDVHRIYLSDAMRVVLCLSKRKRSHTQTHNKNNTTHTTRTPLQTTKRNRSHTQPHDKNNTTNDHTKKHPPHLTTIEGGAATVRTTSHTRVGSRAESIMCVNRTKV